MILCQFIFLFNAAIRKTWQLVCESGLMKPPEIYQFHIMTNKLNRKGKLQVKRTHTPTEGVGSYLVTDDLSIS